jgi:hypothetical protein
LVRIVSDWPFTVAVAVLIAEGGVLVVGAVVAVALVLAGGLLLVVELPQAAISITTRRLLASKKKRLKNMAGSP